MRLVLFRTSRGTWSDPWGRLHRDVDILEEVVEVEETGTWERTNPYTQKLEIEKLYASGNDEYKRLSPYDFGGHTTFLRIRDKNWFVSEVQAKHSRLIGLNGHPIVYEDGANLHNVAEQSKEPDVRHMSESGLVNRIVREFEGETCEEMVFNDDTGRNESVRILFADDIRIIAHRIVYGEYLEDANV